MKHRFVVLLTILFLVPATAAVADNGLVTKPSAHSAEVTLDRLAKALTAAEPPPMTTRSYVSLTIISPNQ